MKKRVPDYLNDHLDDYHFEGRFQIDNDDQDLYGDNETEIYVDEGIYVTSLKQTELYNLDHGVSLSGFNEYSGYSHLGDVNFFIEEHGIYNESYKRDLELKRDADAANGPRKHDQRMKSRRQHSANREERCKQMRERSQMAHVKKARNEYQKEYRRKQKLKLQKQKYEAVI